VASNRNANEIHRRAGPAVNWQFIADTQPLPRPHLRPCFHVLAQVKIIISSETKPPPPAKGNKAKGNATKMYRHPQKNGKRNGSEVKN